MKKAPPGSSKLSKLHSSAMAAKLRSSLVVLSLLTALVSVVEAVPIATFPRNATLPDKRVFGLRLDTGDSDSSGGVILFDLEIRWAMQSPDGYRRPVYLVNGQFPGPTIRVRQGDLAILRIHNQLFSDSISVHVHGLDARLSNPFDGVSMGTQYPIPPQTSFVQKLRITDPPGTYWYHGHHSLQSDRLFGAFLIEHDPKEMEQSSSRLPYAYDEERVVLLADWYHASEDAEMIGLTSSPFQWIGDPDSLLINGKGTFNCTRAGLTRSLCMTPPPWEAMEVIRVQPNKTYRFRLIGATSLSYLAFSIPDHSMTIVEADGMYTEPLANVSTLEINSGQRYSVLVRTHVEPRHRNYAMSVEIRWRKSGPRGQALLQYEYGYPEEGTSENGTEELFGYRGSLDPVSGEWNPGSAPNWILDRLHPLQTYHYPRMPLHATKRFVLHNRQQLFPDPATNRSYLKWAINGVQLEPQSEPLLSQLYRHSPAELQQKHQRKLPLLMEIEEGDVVEVVLQNHAAMNGICEQHPWHLHGHHFWDLGGGPGEYVAHVRNNRSHLSYLNLRNPLRLDTTTLFPYAYAFDANQYTPSVEHAGKPCGWRVLRFVADGNPGVWAMHCHIASHMMGMFVYFVEDLQTLRESRAVFEQANGGIGGF